MENFLILEDIIDIPRETHNIHGYKDNYKEVNFLKFINSMLFQLRLQKFS